MKNGLILMMITLTLSTLSFASHSWNGRIFHAPTQQEISLKKLTAGIIQFPIIILGEKHNTPAIQLAQSEIMNNAVKAKHAENLFITAWEFLNYTDQDNINTAYKNFVSGKIDALSFLQETQGTTNNKSYIPILETTKALKGQIIGVNISREAKDPVVKGGIEALDPKYLPPDFAMGSLEYHQRFVEIMDGHSPPETIENYYAAQCLTDDIMAYTLHKYFNTPLLFLITGSFHTDFFQGVVNRLYIRNNKSVAVIRFIDASDYDEAELNETLPKILYDKTYGTIADYVYFVNEPNTNVIK